MYRSVRLIAAARGMLMPRSVREISQYIHPAPQYCQFVHCSSPLEYRFYHTNDRPLFPSELPDFQPKVTIEGDDIWSIDKYRELRREFLLRRRELKSIRRVPLGPYASVTFESFDLIWIQIQEMLHIENGGDEQLVDELEAYEPLVPKGSDFVATLMFEIDSKPLRERVLYSLGHVEEKVYLQIREEKIFAESANNDIERTMPDGKTSSVHFLRFPFSAEQADLLRSTPTPTIVLGTTHENYLHTTTLSPETAAALVRDLR